jgi:hypothetical protein
MSEKLVIHTLGEDFQFCPKEVTVVLFKAFPYAGVRFLHEHEGYQPCVILFGGRKNAELIGRALKAYGFYVVADASWR